MERYEYLGKTKKEQKQLAVIIRGLKSKRKLDSRDGWSLWKLELEISRNKSMYRHVHIAYCLLRGKTIEQIENPRSYNKPSQSRIDLILEDYAETVCISQD